MKDRHIRYQVQRRPLFSDTRESVSRKFKTYEGAQNAAAKLNAVANLLVTTVPADGYHFESCIGEAHRNALIDNCMVCMPMWVQVVVKDDLGAQLDHNACAQGCGGDEGHAKRPCQDCGKPFSEDCAACNPGELDLGDDDLDEIGGTR